MDSPFHHNRPFRMFDEESGPELMRAIERGKKLKGSLILNTFNDSLWDHILTDRLEECLVQGKDNIITGSNYDSWVEEFRDISEYRRKDILCGLMNGGAVPNIAYNAFNL